MQRLKIALQQQMNPIFSEVELDGRCFCKGEG
jgi:hypothetical protein